MIRVCVVQKEFRPPDSPGDDVKIMGVPYESTLVFTLGYTSPGQDNRCIAN